MKKDAENIIVSDGALIRLFFLRDETALELVAKKYGKLFSHIASRVLGDDRDAEECVNDTYLRLWDTIPPNRPSSVKAYGAKIARNLALNRVEYNSAEKRSGTEQLTDELSEILTDTGDEATDEELRSALERFLRGLGKEERITFVKRYWYSESVAEIASSLGCGEEKIKSRLFRTRRKLRTYLEKEGISL